jgi:hypothetical protein
MTNCATRARLGVIDPGSVCDSRRTSIEQNRVGTGVKILPGPSQVLAAFFPCASVTTGRPASGGADKLRWICGRLPDFFANRPR